MSQNKYLLGLDIGGTKTEAALLAMDNLPEICHRKRIPTERNRGLGSFLSNLQILGEELLSSANVAWSEIVGIGVGLPGTVDPRDGLMKIGNTNMFAEKPFKEQIKSLWQYSGKISIANDANCFALAEAKYGAGSKLSNGIGLILGTGVGGGIILDGKLFVGKSGAAAEVGHTTYVPNGLPCYCGRRGCFEQYLSGPALEALFRSRSYSQLLPLESTKKIFELYQQEEPISKAVVFEYRKFLLDFLVQLTNTFDPDYFVLGGGLSNQNVLWEGLEDRLAQERFNKGEPVLIKSNELGDSSGVIGAALLSHPAT